MFSCRWDHCRHAYPSRPELRTHLTTDHILRDSRISASSVHLERRKDGCIYAREKGIESLLGPQSLSSNPNPSTSKSTQIQSSSVGPTTQPHSTEIRPRTSSAESRAFLSSQSGSSLTGHPPLTQNPRIILGCTSPATLPTSTPTPNASSSTSYSYSTSSNEKQSRPQESSSSRRTAIAESHGHRQIRTIRTAHSSVSGGGGQADGHREPSDSPVRGRTIRGLAESDRNESRNADVAIPSRRDGLAPLARAVRGPSRPIDDIYFGLALPAKPTSPRHTSRIASSVPTPSAPVEADAATPTPTSSISELAASHPSETFPQPPPIPEPEPQPGRYAPMTRVLPQRKKIVLRFPSPSATTTVTTAGSSTGPTTALWAPNRTGKSAVHATSWPMSGHPSRRSSNSRERSSILSMEMTPSAAEAASTRHFLPFGTGGVASPSTTVHGPPVPIVPAFGGLTGGQYARPGSKVGEEAAEHDISTSGRKRLGEELTQDEGPYKRPAVKGEPGAVSRDASPRTGNGKQSVRFGFGSGRS